MPANVERVRCKDRGFGTASRFSRQNSEVTSPGPFTTHQNLQLRNGARSMDFRSQTKSQCFSTTCKRFAMNEAIVAAKQNIPDPINPGPDRYVILSKFDRISNQAANRNASTARNRGGRLRSSTPPSTPHEALSARRPQGFTTRMSYMDAFEIMEAKSWQQAERENQ